jgi:Fe-S oxidoreductase
MGFIARWARLAALAPRLVNFLASFPPTSAAARWLAGIHPAREIPRFAPETFRAWFARRAKARRLAPAPQPATREAPRRVVLWPDTFTDHFRPQVARAAVTALEAGGFEVVIPRRPWCCGRPLYDFGFVATARRWLGDILEGMRPEIRAGLPFIFLEPSYGAVFRDELRGLFPHDLDAKRLGEQSFLLADFLLRQESYPWPRLPGALVVQGHCHHKSVFGFEGEEKALRKICGDVRVLDGGCCGMAGSFGFEKEHYAVSRAVGEYRLLPAVRNVGDARVVANGFSCHEQLRQLGGKDSLHFAEILAEALAANVGREEEAGDAASA